LSAADVAQPPPEAEELAQQITEDGGTVLAAYKDPLKGSGLVFAAIPIEQIERTPWQRDLSDAHRKRLQDVIDKVGVFLDPIIATREGSQKYHSPNGGHRLEAMRNLGAKTIAALVVPDRAIAWRILALNTEKAHALKEKALEVWRMETAMHAEDGDRREAGFELEYEEAALLTLGAAYEKHGRLSGGAYRSPLKRVETFLDVPLGEAIEIRRARGDKLLALDEKVSEVVAALKARGFQSPYLRQFVAARINPIRFAKTVDMTPEELLDKMIEKAEKFDVGAVKEDQVQSAGGFGGGDDE
jgi:ParB family chromosome partitioning protein